MTHNLRKPSDRKYYGHTTDKPKKWLPITRRVTKTALPRKAGPVKLNPAYVEWKEKKEARIREIKYKRFFQKKTTQINK